MAYFSNNPKRPSLKKLMLQKYMQLYLHRSYDAGIISKNRATKKANGC